MVGHPGGADVGGDAFGVVDHAGLQIGEGAVAGVEAAEGGEAGSGAKQTGDLAGSVLFGGFVSAAFEGVLEVGHIRIWGCGRWGSWQSGGMKRTNWKDLHDVLVQVYRILQAEWGCQPAGYTQEPAAGVEAECDYWCEVLARDLCAEIEPPERVRPWLLARILMAAADATTHGDRPFPGVTPATVQQYLIGEWHGALKARWKMLDDLPWGFAE